MENISKNESLIKQIVLIEWKMFTNTKILVRVLLVKMKKEISSHLDLHIGICLMKMY